MYQTLELDLYVYVLYSNKTIHLDLWSCNYPFLLLIQLQNHDEIMVKCDRFIFLNV